MGKEGRRVTVVDGLETAQGRDVGLPDVGQVQKEVPPRRGGELSPLPMQGGFGGSDGAVDVGLASEGDVDQHLLGGGIDHPEGFAAGSGAVLVVDPQASLLLIEEAVEFLGPAALFLHSSCSAAARLSLAQAKKQTLAPPPPIADFV